MLGTDWQKVAYTIFTRALQDVNDFKASSAFLGTDEEKKVQACDFVNQLISRSHIEGMEKATPGNLNNFHVRLSHGTDIVLSYWQVIPESLRSDAPRQMVTKWRIEPVFSAEAGRVLDKINPQAPETGELINGKPFEMRIHASVPVP